MHAAGLARQSYGPGDLERCRNRLLAELAELLNDQQRLRTVVVFDAKDSVGFLGSSSTVSEMSVIYPDRGIEADAVLERLIKKHSAPRGLTVVSSDHRIQVAATRRRATAIDSEDFLKRQRRISRSPRGPEKPEVSDVPDAEVEFWTQELEDLLGE